MYNLPENLKQAITSLSERESIGQLSKARDSLTTKYRSKYSNTEMTPFLSTAQERLSYLITRLPATYASVSYCLNELKKSFPDLILESFLDLGAGPGTASWAVQQFYPEIATHALLEKDQGMIALGKELVQLAESLTTSGTLWTCMDFASMQNIPSADLTICSYSLGEIAENRQEEVLDHIWAKTNKIMLLIEPGSMRGFGHIKRWRQRIIDAGGCLIAPCPHQNACPMPSTDWCHFSVRLERSRLHRQMKQGDLSYEDEKFSYVIFSRLPFHQKCFQRILRLPEKHKGHVRMQLCGPLGLEAKTYSRRDEGTYKQAKKLEWGDKIEDHV